MKPFLYAVYISCTLLLAASCNANAKNYYIDFELGSNQNSGSSKSTPWKHAPGDSNASSIPAQTTLEPGDNLFFRGGTRYRGSIKLNSSGTGSKPISFIGNEWGSENSILDGSYVSNSQITPCSDEIDCMGNSNWRYIYKTQLNEIPEIIAPLYIDDEILWAARTPNQEEPFFYDNLEQYFEINHKSSSTSITENHLKTSTLLNSEAFSNWDDSFIAIWMRPNLVYLSEITSADNENNTLYFDPIKAKPYLDRTSYYAFFNRVDDLDKEGEYRVDRDSKTLYFWPNSRNPKSISIPFLANTFIINGNSGIKITGFDMEKYAGDTKTWTSGANILNRVPGSENIEISYNVIRNNFSPLGNGGIELRNTSGAYIHHNNIHNNLKSSGIRAYKSKKIAIQHNTIKKIGRTGIRLISTENVTISNNIISDITGIHGNGISAYLYNENILIAENYVTNTTRALTFHGDYKLEDHFYNIIVLNNKFFGSVNSWGKNFSGAYFLHNLFEYKTKKHLSLALNKNDTEMVIANNIIAGLISYPDTSNIEVNNVFTALAYLQSEKYGWELGPGSFIDSSYKPSAIPTPRTPTSGIPKPVTIFTDQDKVQPITIPLNLFTNYDSSYLNSNEKIPPGPILLEPLQ